MKLALTRRGDYTLRAALYLAEDHAREGYAKIKDVASAMSLPLSYTPQVLLLLAKSGIAEAKPGRDGGYRLSRPPEAVSVLEVVEAAEGDLRSKTCILRGGPCHWEDACAAHASWSDASEAFRASLQMTTLADLADTDRRLAAGRARGRRTP
jgi:Rrf2 family protein